VCAVCKNFFGMQIFFIDRFALKQSCFGRALFGLRTGNAILKHTHRPLVEHIYQARARIETPNAWSRT
jgi:hypothetical protein